MASETITRNDLTAILNEVLPPTPSEYKKLLWTNPSPSSAFAGQTITLDLSDYDEIEIEYQDNQYVGINKSVSTTVGASSYIFTTAGGSGARQVTVNANSIEFGAGIYYSSYGGGGSTTNNGVCIPSYIYGIKYERVAPPAMDALEWKLKGTATNNNTVAMPTEYNEVLLWASYGTVYFSAVVPKSEISNTAVFPRGSFYYNASNNEAITFKATSTEAKIETWHYNGGNVRTSDLTFKLYYR